METLLLWIFGIGILLSLLSVPLFLLTGRVRQVERQMDAIFKMMEMRPKTKILPFDPKKRRDQRGY